MNLAIDLLSWALMLLGGFFCVTAAIGLIRLPDFLSRTHAASIADSFGAVMILFGMILQSGWNLVSAKLAMIILLLLITAPATGHALARAALHARLETDPATRHDPETRP